jgi:hypothetical protein
MVARAKNNSQPYIDWKNRPYAVNAGSEEKRKQGERWEALNTFIRKHGGAVVSVPGAKTLRVEVPKDSLLPAKLAELGYNVSSHGTVSRVTGAPSITAKMERLTHEVPSAFAEMNCYEIRLDGK